MKALVFENAGELRDLVHLKQVEEPGITATQVLVQVKARPLNPSDYLFVKGVYRKKPAFPQIAGLEGAGIVVKCGELAEGFAPGDHVAFRGLNTWAEYCAADHKDLIKVNRDIPFEVSCQVGLNGITAIALLEMSMVGRGQFLLLNASSSSLAHIIIQLAVGKGIKVIALVGNISHKSQLTLLGVEDVLVQTDPEFPRKLSALTNNTGIHGFLDAVGGQMLTAIIPLMARYGQIIVYGNLSNNQQAAFANADIIYKNLTILGFGIDYWLSRQDSFKIQQAYDGIIEGLYNGSLSFRKTVSIPLEEFENKTNYLNTKDKIIIV